MKNSGPVIDFQCGFSFEIEKDLGRPIYSKPAIGQPQVIVLPRLTWGQWAVLMAEGEQVGINLKHRVREKECRYV
jgi:hypothetical protein